MQKIGLFIFYTAAFFYSTNNFAMFCPENLNQINVGDTIDQVTLQCGPPTSIKTFKSEEDIPQEWNYYVTQALQYPQTGSMRMSIAFEKGKVINISVNGAGVTYTAICGKPITLEYTQKQVEAICGKPVFINKGTTQQGTAGGVEQAKEITEFNYTGTTDITLIFENGKFTRRK